MKSKDIALKIADAALEKLAKFLEIVDVRDKVDYTDYLVICSGGSTRHVNAIAEAIEIKLKEVNLYPLGVEGKESGQWLLIDFGDVIAHVFEEEKRGFYDMDSLWIDADRIPVRFKN